jgi:hypothetical protein
MQKRDKMKNRINKIQNKIRQIKPQKVGAALTILTLCAICGIGGYELRSSTDSNSSVLPVGKGGTGANTFAAGQALIGNGAGALTTRGIDTAPVSGSNNLITSGGVNSVNNTARNGGAINNFYKEITNTWTSAQEKVIFLGKVPTAANDDPNRTLLNTDLFARRIGGYPSMLDINIKVNFQYTSTTVDAKYCSITNHESLIWETATRTYSLITFTYNKRKYIGLRYKQIFNNEPLFFQGFYYGSLPFTCTDGDICFLSAVNIQDVTVNNTLREIEIAPLATP